MFNFPTSGTTSEHQPRGRPCHPRPAARRSASQGPSLGMWVTPQPDAGPSPDWENRCSEAQGYREAGQPGLASSPFNTRSPASTSKLSQGQPRCSPGTESPSAELRSDSDPSAGPAQRAGGGLHHTARPCLGCWRPGTSPASSGLGRLKVNVRQRQTSWKARMKRGDRRESGGLLSARPRRGRGPSAGRAGPGRRGTGDFT